MKTIKLKESKEKVVIAGKEMDIDISTIELLRSAINSPAEGGYTVADMAARLKLLNIIKEGDESLSLEDADFIYLANLVRSMKWNILSEFIIDFSQQFN